MKCPTCPDAVLVMSERQGVEIDYCPTCRGVWLDRGELDKIIERAGAELGVASVPTQQAPPPPSSPPRYDERRDDRRYEERRYDDGKHRSKYDDDYKYKKKKKKSSFLEDLFEF